MLMKAYQRAANYAAKHQVLVFSSAGNKGVNLDEMRKRKQGAFAERFEARRISRQQYEKQQYFPILQSRAGN
ncbi:hypothetical protein PO124_15415 [Bacillus licheniformis]|nr:hypothetical protein [Bacillus licheniformis]